MNKTFNQEYLSSFIPNFAQIKLRELAIQYIEETENYDQIICQIKNKYGIAIPTTPRERGLCSINASNLFNKLMIEVEGLNFTRAEFLKEIQNINK